MRHDVCFLINCELFSVSLRSREGLKHRITLENIIYTWWMCQAIQVLKVMCTQNAVIHAKAIKNFSPLSVAFVSEREEIELKARWAKTHFV